MAKEPIDQSAESPEVPVNPVTSGDDTSPADLPDLDSGADTDAELSLAAEDAPVDPAHAVDMLGDVELDVKIELGRCRMYVGDVLRLSPGSVVELDKLAGDPVDVYVNERLVARGEVLVVNDSFCVRVNDVLSAES